MLQKQLVLNFLILLALGFQQALAQPSGNNGTVNGTATPPSTQASVNNTLSPIINGTTSAIGAGTSSSTSTTKSSTSSKTVAPTTTPATTTPKTTTTTTITTTTNGHVDPSINQICPQNSGVNDKIRRKALEMINWRRSELALGRVTKRNNNPMPRASNMIQLKYDCTLEVAAKDRALSCTTEEIPGGLENMYRVPVSSVRNRVEAMEKASKEWWKQVRKDTPIGAAVTFRAHHQFLPIRSFTRMAWANTQRMGCAVKRCGEFWNAVCHYDPPGNVVGEQIYIRGKPCSRCPSNASCNDGLCVLPGSR